MSDGSPLGTEPDLDPDAGKSQQQLVDEMTGQLRLFDDEES
jgi:topoisomerase-4 subunit A